MSTRRWQIYLLHFSAPYHHARHYLGTSTDVGERLAEHLSGRGSPLVGAALRAGIEVTLVRVWPSGGRPRERKLKRSKNVPRLCPICRGARRHPVSTSAVDETAAGVEEICAEAA
jgi:predicted GIY-YIG superfamily endonuclease